MKCLTNNSVRVDILHFWHVLHSEQSECSVNHITKTCLYSFDPLKPHFYIVKLGFTGVYIIFLIFANKHRLWYSLEPPRRGGYNEYPQSMFWAEIWKILEFLSEFFQFLQVKFSIHLNRRVFIWVFELTVAFLNKYSFSVLSTWWHASQWLWEFMPTRCTKLAAKNY